MKSILKNKHFCIFRGLRNISLLGSIQSSKFDIWHLEGLEMSNMDLRASMEHAAKKVKVNQLLALRHPRTLEAHARLLSQVSLGPFFRPFGRKGIELKQVRSNDFFALRCASCVSSALDSSTLSPAFVPAPSPLAFIQASPKSPPSTDRQPRWIEAQDFIVSQLLKCLSPPLLGAPIACEVYCLPRSIRTHTSQPFSTPP